MTERVDKDSLPLNQPRRTPNHPTKSHIVKTKVNGKEKIIRFGEQGASTAGKPKEGESDRMKAKRASFKSRHAKNIAKGPASAAYWADKVKWADGGSVKLNYDTGGTIRATPQNATLGAIADFLKQSYAPQRTQQMQGVAEFLGIPATARTIERLSYGEPITNINRANVPLLLSDTAEAAMVVGPMAGPLARAGKTAGKAGARLVGEELNRAILDNSGALSRLVPEAAKPLYAVKPKGGNWAPAIGSQDSVEASIKPLRSVVREPEFLKRIADEEARGLTQPGMLESVTQQNSKAEAANKWLDTKLQKYIRNEMGTPDDPIRLAHEEGYSHIPGDLAEEFGSWLPEDTAAARRKAGYPEHGFAVQKHMDAGYPEAMEGDIRKAELWENLADTEITQSPAGAYQEQWRIARDFPSTVGNSKQALQVAERNPWMEKLDRNTPIYKIDNPVELNTNLGFGHLSDELRNMLDPNSGLPANLRLTPEQLDKVTVKQMVERVSKINDWRAEEAAKAEREGMMGNLTATPRLEIPDVKLSFVDKPGMKWVDIPETTDEAGRNLCTTIGRQAGWCTQGEGLAKRYGSGENRLTTLIDAEGRPHAQAMIKKSVDQNAAVEDATMYMTPEQEAAYDRHFSRFDRPPELEDSLEWLKENAPSAYKTYEDVLASQPDLPPSIIELKPVGNEFSSARAREYEKRDPQYKAKVTDSVLEFLNAGNWGKVNDLDHYDIVDLQNPAVVKRALADVLGYDLPHERMDKFTAATHFNPDTQRFMSRSQFREFVEPSGNGKPGYAEGGLVGTPITTYDPFQVDEVMNTINAPQGYAEGGSVSAYDPSRVDAILNQFM